MRLDHIAISGETLEEATEHVEAALGVRLEPGGAHDVFSTHNRLLELADGLYLEAIAIDPDAPDPTRPRWFDLDAFFGPARLTNWICATDDLDAALAALPAGFGTPVDLTRGDLHWRMAVPENGMLPHDNCAPALIQWQAGAHPSTRLPPSGVRLAQLVVRHPQGGALAGALRRHMADPRLSIEVGKAGMMAEFDTPHGRRVIGG